MSINTANLITTPNGQAELAEVHRVNAQLFADHREISIELLFPYIAISQKTPEVIEDISETTSELIKQEPCWANVDICQVQTYTVQGVQKRDFAIGGLFDVKQDINNALTIILYAQTRIVDSRSAEKKEEDGNRSATNIVAENYGYTAKILPYAYTKILDSDGVYSESGITIGASRYGRSRHRFYFNYIIDNNDGIANNITVNDNVYPYSDGYLSKTAFELGLERYKNAIETELDVLKERMVTTYREDDPDLGDDQTIKGTKTFEWPVVLFTQSGKKAKVGSTGLTFHVGNESNPTASITGFVNSFIIDGPVSYNATVSIVAGKNDTDNLGNNTRIEIRHWGEAVDEHGDPTYDPANSIDFYINSEDDPVVTISYDENEHQYQLYSVNVSTQNIRVTNSLTATGSNFRIIANRNSNSSSMIEFNRYTGIGLMLVSTSEDINVVSGSNILLSAGDGSGSINLLGGLNVGGDVIFGENVGKGSNSTDAGNLLYYNSASDGESNGNLKLSKLSGVQASLYIAEAATHAKVDSSDSTKADCPVGSIVYAILAGNIKGSGVKVNPGETFSISGNAYVAELSSSGWAIGLSLPAGKYKALHSIVFTGLAQTLPSPALIQRIAD